MSALTTRERAIDVLTTHKHGDENRTPCEHCAGFYGDIVDRLIAAGVLVDVDTLASDEAAVKRIAELWARGAWDYRDEPTRKRDITMGRHWLRALATHLAAEVAQS